MHLSHIIRKEGCNVDVDPPLQQSKYTSFDKHTLRHMQYVMDAQDNYVKKPEKGPEQPELKRRDEPDGQHGSETQPEAPAVSKAPTQDPSTQGPPAPSFPALSDM